MKPTAKTIEEVEKAYTMKQIEAVVDKYYHDVLQSKTPVLVDLYDLKAFIRAKI